MENTSQNSFINRRNPFVPFSNVQWLGIWIGIVMPVISALVYPTYMHAMQIHWLEYSRLLEVPFVLFEILIIFRASHQRIDWKELWHALPTDIKAALILLLVGVFASSAFTSKELLKSLTISFFTVVHLLFAFATYHLIRRSSLRDFDEFLKFLGSGLILLAAFTFWRFSFPPPASTVRGGVIEWGSALPGFINVRLFGSWTGAIACGFLVKLLFDDRPNRNSLLLMFYFFSIAMTIWSGTRAAVLAIVVTAFAISVAKRQLPTLQSMRTTAILTGGAIVAAWVLLPYNDPAFMLFNHDDAANANSFAGGRLELWSATFQRWQHSPIFGFGSGSTLWEVNVGWPHTQPHNAILQFLISWGVIGAAPALWLLGRGVLRVHIAALRSTTLLPLLAILYALLIMSMLEGMLHYPQFIILIIVMFAAIMAYDSNSRQVGAAT